MSQTFASRSVSVAVMRGDAVMTAGPHPRLSIGALCRLARSLCSPAMLATYGSLLLILVASCLVGEALLALCARRELSLRAPLLAAALRRGGGGAARPGGGGGWVVLVWAPRGRAGAADRGGLG